MNSITTTGRVGRGSSVHALIGNEPNLVPACGSSGSGYRARIITPTGERVTCSRCQRPS